MKNLTLYTAHPSRGQMVRWMLEECGAQYETVTLELGRDNLTPEYLAVNPLGKVPSLKAGDRVITETAAIITYLAEQFPEKGLIPAAGSIERGEYYRWLCFSLHLEYAAVDKIRGVENAPEARKMLGYGEFGAALDVLRRHLDGREFIVGDRFSAMDLYYSGLLGWFAQMKVLENDAVFDGYSARHLARPSGAE